MNHFTTESIYYSEFKGHTGFKFMHEWQAPDGRRGNVKMEGWHADFGLIKRNRTEVYWKVPTGKPGFGFWNVTKKCELIGRKYRVVE